MSEAIVFPVWKGGPLAVGVVREGQPVTPLVFGLRGDVYSVTGTLLQAKADVVEVAKSLGVAPRRPRSDRETNWLQSQLDVAKVRAMFPAPERATPRAEGVREGRETEQIPFRDSAREEREALAKAEADLREFLVGEGCVVHAVRERDPRIPAEALKHAKDTRAAVMLVIELRDRNGRTAVAVAAVPDLFWPGVPGRAEGGKGVIARHRWAATDLAARFKARKAAPEASP